MRENQKIYVNNSKKFETIPFRLVLAHVALGVWLQDDIFNFYLFHVNVISLGFGPKMPFWLAFIAVSFRIIFLFMFFIILIVWIYNEVKLRKLNIFVLDKYFILRAWVMVAFSWLTVIHVDIILFTLPKLFAVFLTFF